jgi:hypothetical protein
VLENARGLITLYWMCITGPETRRIGRARTERRSRRGERMGRRGRGGEWEWRQVRGGVEASEWTRRDSTLWRCAALQPLLSQAAIHPRSLDCLDSPPATPTAALGWLRAGKALCRRLAAPLAAPLASQPPRYHRREPQRGRLARNLCPALPRVGHSVPPSDAS